MSMPKMKKYKIKRAQAFSGYFTMATPFYPLSASYRPAQSETDAVSMNDILSNMDTTIVLPQFHTLNALGMKSLVANLDKLDLTSEMLPAGIYALSNGQTYLHVLLDASISQDPIKGFHPEKLPPGTPGSSYYSG